MSAFDIGLRTQLARYLTGESSLREFRRWFLPLMWDLTQENQLVSPLARRIELHLAEYMNGHWTEDALKRLFAREAPITGSLCAPFHPVLSGTVAGQPQSAARLQSEYLVTT